MQPTVLTKAEDVSTSAPPKIFAEDGNSTASPSMDASKSGKQEDEHEDDWEDSASLYEEFLDDTEAFPYASGTNIQLSASFPFY